MSCASSRAHSAAVSTTLRETVMANDADWVEDVKRWYLSGTSNASGVTADAGDDPVAIGYEAAHPALQAKHWPDAPSASPDKSSF
jgi:hypothetical protein